MSTVSKVKAQIKNFGGKGFRVSEPIFLGEWLTAGYGVIKNYGVKFRINLGFVAVCQKYVLVGWMDWKNGFERFDVIG